MTVKYCDRSLHQNSYFVGLCTDEKSFKQELKKLGVHPEDASSFTKNEHSDAACHFFQHSNGNKIALVCIRVPDGTTGTKVAALLVHEAVHIWQAHRDDIGEKQPSAEFEAYAIQTISMQLMEAYKDCIGVKNG